MTTRRSTPINRTRSHSWRAIDLETQFAAWHLCRRGITDPAEIARLIGKRIHATSLTALIDGLDSVVLGPLPLSAAVRCGGCGVAIQEIPCLRCRLAGKNVHTYTPVQNPAIIIKE